MDRELKELIEISRTVGEDKELVLAGFGNTSVKSDDGRYMYIKASGTALKDMSRRRGWRKVELDAVMRIIGDREIGGLSGAVREAVVAKRFLAACVDGLGDEIKCSIETGFHSVFGKYVIHLHPVWPSAVACSNGGEGIVEELFGKGEGGAWVRYADLGYALWRRVKNVCGKYEKEYGQRPCILFLQNHGVVVSAETAGEAIGLVKKVVRVCKKRCGGFRMPKVEKPLAGVVKKTAELIEKVYANVGGEQVTFKFCGNENALRLGGIRNGKEVCKGCAITPDEVVYTGGPALWVEKLDQECIETSLEKFKKANGRVGRCVIVKGVGLFVVESPKWKLVGDICVNCVTIRAGSVKLGGLHHLNDRQREFILSLGG